MSLSYLVVTGSRCDIWSGERIDLEENGMRAATHGGGCPEFILKVFKSFDFDGGELYKVKNIREIDVCMTRRMPPIISDVFMTFGDFSDVVLTNPDSTD